VLPHSAFRRQTPEEKYFGSGNPVPAELIARVAAARRTHGGQSIGILQDVPAPQRGMTLDC
jgi:hypothetical protein